MKTSSQIADIVLNLIKANVQALAERVLYVERVGDSGVKIGVNDGGDLLEYYITCAGASMVEGKIDETQSQGLGERVARRTRVVTPEPPIKMMDKTPKRPADNSPMKTSRGRAAVKRRGSINKSHPKQFKESSEFIDAMLCTDAGRDGMASASMSLDDPVSESSLIESIIASNPGSKHIDKLKYINEVIHNVWEGKLYQRSIGIANTRDGELVVFGQAAAALAEAKKWGYNLCWIERIRKAGVVIYKVFGDTTPSEVFMEHKNCSDRDVILSTNRANIIQIIYGDTK